MKKVLLFVVAAMFVTLSCTKPSPAKAEDPGKEQPSKEDPETPGTTEGKVEISAETQALITEGIVFSAQGETVQIKFKATADWTVETTDVKSGSEWLSASPASGKASDAVTVTLTASSNDVEQDRSASVKIVCGKDSKDFTVSQEAAAHVLSFNDYMLPDKIILYDDQWIPSSENITITPSGAGKVDVDYVCKEDPAQGNSCIKWVLPKGAFTTEHFVRLDFAPYIDLSAFEKSGYSIEFKVKSNWWINGNVFQVILRDSPENEDKTPWLYSQNVIHNFDADTPKSAEEPDGTLHPDTWYQISIPLDEMWGKNKELDGTAVDWSGKSLRDGSTNGKWLPDLKALATFGFYAKSPTIPEGDEIIVWFDDIQICAPTITPKP